MRASANSGGEFASGWPLVAASFLGIAFSVSVLGAGYSLGLFVQPLEAEFGWRRGQIQLAPLVLAGSVIPMSFVVGWIADRFGAKRLIVLSQFGFGLVFVALGSMTHDLATFYALYFAMGVLGSGTLPMTFTKILTNAFTAKRGLAIGLALSGTGLCAFAVPIYGALLIEQFGWRGGFVGLALLPVLIAMPVAMWLLPADPVRATAATGAIVPAQPMEGMDVMDALRTWQYWAIALAFGLASAAATGVLGNLVPLLMDHGHARLEAGELAASFGIAVLLGRLAVGYLVDYMWGPLVALFFLLPAVFATYVLSDGQWGVGWTLAAIIAVGLATGAEFDLAAYLCGRYFGRRRYATLYAGQFVLFALGGASATAIFGRMHDHFGSYELALLGSGVAFLLCAALLLSLGKYPSWPDEEDGLTID
jgi:MFS family permease